MINEELQEFIEQNEFVRVDGDLFEDPGGHIWHLDDIWDLMQEKARESVDWLT